ncbi:MAG TPA: LuxR C-terminal-related transcriptional regulator, partial [Ktedonobacterales bacterium]|nr:LuxR C-terminal-related transcriptional regulator [Ktedonobacterales bacterium]
RLVSQECGGLRLTSRILQPLGQRQRLLQRPPSPLDIAVEREISNLRAALRWLIDQDGAKEREAGLRLAGALGYFWLARGYHTEGRRWLEEALARAPAAEASARARALRSAGYLLALHGDVERARGTLEEALTLAERLKDPASKAQATTLLGYQAVLAGDVAEGMRRFTEALRQWEAIGNRGGLGQTQFYVGVVAAAVGDLDAAAARYTEALQSLGAAGDETGAGFAHCLFGVVELQRGHLHLAVEHVRTGVGISLNLRDRWLLSFAAQAATAVVGARDETTGQLRLLGATDALAQATGASHIAQQTMPGGQEVMALRERLARGEEGDVRPLPSEYQEGRALRFGEVATLALRLLDEVSQSLTRSDGAGTVQRPAVQPANQSPLSIRELDVLRLVAQGHSSKEIARRLSLSPSTINQHVKGIFNKLEVETRAQAVAVAAQRGLL